MINYSIENSITHVILLLSSAFWLFIYLQFSSVLGYIGVTFTFGLTRISSF